ncbi:MAG: hypothetical protein RR902_06275 [Oscillospiraceae bacterium]
MKENKTYPEKTVEIVVKWVMFTAAICGMALISAFFPIYANIPLIVIPSILVLIFSKPVFFEKLKLTTLVAMRILVIFAALRFFNPQVYVDIIMLMLIVNILEATFTDLLRHKKIFNAISGFALAVGVVALRGTWLFETTVGDYYVAKGVLPIVTLLYVVAYTLWNWIFVTNEFSDSVALMHVGFLGAPIIGALCTIWLGPAGGLGMWLLLRANSLAIGGWMQISAKSWFEREFHSEKFASFVNWTKKKPVQITLMIVNVALIAAAIIITLLNGGISFSFASFTL